MFLSYYYTHLIIFNVKHRLFSREKRYSFLFSFSDFYIGRYVVTYARNRRKNDADVILFSDHTPFVNQGNFIYNARLLCYVK